MGSSFDSAPIASGVVDGMGQKAGRLESSAFGPNISTKAYSISGSSIATSHPLHKCVIAATVFKGDSQLTRASRFLAAHSSFAYGIRLGGWDRGRLIGGICQLGPVFVPIVWAHFHATYLAFRELLDCFAVLGWYRFFSAAHL